MVGSQIEIKEVLQTGGEPLLRRRDEESLPGFERPVLVDRQIRIGLQQVVQRNNKIPRQVSFSRGATRTATAKRSPVLLISILAGGDPGGLLRARARNPSDRPE